jgi:hypothetical protein
MNPPRRPAAQAPMHHLPRDISMMSPSSLRSSSVRGHQFRPTPTFSFAEELAAEQRIEPRSSRGRSGSGLLLVFLMALAGTGGYAAVKYRVWQDPGPLVARAQELGRSLRTLAPWASPDVPTPAPVAPPPTAAAPRLMPDVVPITRAPEPTAGDASHRRTPRR